MPEAQLLSVLHFCVSGSRGEASSSRRHPSCIGSATASMLVTAYRYVTYAGSWLFLFGGFYNEKPAMLQACWCPVAACAPTPAMFKLRQLHIPGMRPRSTVPADSQACFTHTTVREDHPISSQTIVRSRVARL